MSFYTSLTGLNGAQADISTISNNIANVGTTGFKRARAEFGDIFATSPLQNASSAIGSGTILKSIKQQFTQGNIQSSLNALDLAISGQGFFAMKPSLTSSQTVYTRNGSFSVNNDRYVVDSKGQYLQVFPVNADGSVTSTSISSAQNLQLPVNSGLPSATTKIQLGLNLPADATIIPNDPKYTASNPYQFNRTDSSTFNQSTSITIYDSLGNPTIATIYYVKTSNATDISPFNKWQTHVFVGDKELDPALITAKDEQGKTLYINKFGEITSDPQSKDSTFVAGAPHPLYKYDDQTEKASSTAAQATGINIKALGFDFGDTDSNTVTITNDPANWSKTREGGNTDASALYWGENMFTISDGNSQPVSVSIRAGKYTGTALAAELTRAVNEAFGDDKFVKITDTYQRIDGQVVNGNDIIKLNLFALDDNGTPKGLTNPIEIDLLGDSGSIGTLPDTASAPVAAPERDLQLTRDQLVNLVQNRLNDAMNLRAKEFGKSAGWVVSSKSETWPVTVGYDPSTRALTFTPNRNLIGPNASELQARFNSMQVFSPMASNLGIPTVQTSSNTLIRAGSVWSGDELVPNGDPILDPADHRYGIQVSYNKDTRQFSFVSGSTGETSAIRVGRAALANDSAVKAQIDSYDFSNTTLAAGESLSLLIDGKSFTYTNPSAVSPNSVVGTLATADKLSTSSKLITALGFSAGNKVNLKIDGGAIVDVLTVKSASATGVTPVVNESTVQDLIDAINNNSTLNPIGAGTTVLASLDTTGNIKITSMEGKAITLSTDGSTTAFAKLTGASGVKYLLDAGNPANTTFTGSLAYTASTKVLTATTILPGSGNLSFTDGKIISLKIDGAAAVDVLTIDASTGSESTVGDLIAAINSNTTLNPNGTSTAVEASLDATTGNLVIVSKVGGTVTLSTNDTSAAFAKLTGTNAQTVTTSPGSGSPSSLTGTALVDAIVESYNARSGKSISETQKLTFGANTSTTAFVITIGGVNVTIDPTTDKTADQVATKVYNTLKASAAFLGRTLVQPGTTGSSVAGTTSTSEINITFDSAAGDVAPLALTVPSNITGTIVSVSEVQKGSNLPAQGYSLSAATTLGTKNGKLLITGSSDGSSFESTVRVKGTIRAKEAVGADNSASRAGVMLGSADFGKTDDTPFLGSNNDLLGIGKDADAQVQDKTGTGLTSTSAIAVGSRAITSLAQTFVPNETLGENKMTFTIDGVVGTVTLPVRAYTGDTFASAIEERVNLIEDPETGKTVSGVKVRFDPDNNRLIFTSGTTGSASQINVVGSPNYGLRNVTTQQGAIPVITVLKQAEDADQNKLYIDENGNITTQTQPTPNWVPLYLNQGQLTFDTVGKLSSPKEGVVYSPFDPGNGSNLINLNVDYGKFSTQYAQPFSVLSLQQDGYTSGKLDGLNIDASGTVRANYTNGQTQALGKIMLANFANPNGLKQVGNSNYVATSVSGDANLGQAGGDGFGSIQSGSLERSNVDITEELVNLITAQRNFQANSKAIETETTLTQTIIQIRG